MKKICVITGTRAEYGLLKPLIQKIDRDDDLDLQLLSDAVLMIIAIFVLFLVASYFLFNPAREMRAKRRAGRDL